MENKNSFEDMIKDLEDIAKDLESGNLTLEESIEKFEKGIEISKECSKVLENTEKKISILIKDNDDNIEEKDFEVE